jgi:DNA-binding NarL/FixJ family response regulator
LLTVETGTPQKWAGIPRERRYEVARGLLLDAIAALPDEAEKPAEFIRAAILAMSPVLAMPSGVHVGESLPALPPEEKMPSPVLAALSKREMETAVLVSVGRTNQQIAHTLGLSQKTVETYLTRIFRKLNVCSRSQIATLIGRSESIRTGLRQGGC